MNYLEQAKKELARADKSHQAVRRMFGLHLVKTEQIEKHFAEILIAQQEDREIGDYNIYLNIEQDRARKRVADAEKFVKRIEEYLNTPST